MIHVLEAPTPVTDNSHGPGCMQFIQWKGEREGTIYIFVGSCLATKVFIGNLPAMGRGWVIIK